MVETTLFLNMLKDYTIITKSDGLMSYYEATSPKNFRIILPDKTFVYVNLSQKMIYCKRCRKKKKALCELITDIIAEVKKFKKGHKCI